MLPKASLCYRSHCGCCCIFSHLISPTPDPHGTSVFYRLLSTPQARLARPHTPDKQSDRDRAPLPHIRGSTAVRPLTAESMTLPFPVPHEKYLHIIYTPPAPETLHIVRPKGWLPAAAAADWASNSFLTT
jgi:hypothetical protein